MKKTDFDTTRRNFKVYTDGACEPNPGNGGYCAVIFGTGDTTPWIVITGGCKKTTNNRMEIMGVLASLKHIKQPSTITFFSDSQYVCNTINFWLAKWKYKGEEKMNMDLWNEIWKLRQKHKVNAVWIKGHNGNFFNEYADSQSLEMVGKAKSGKRKKFENIKILSK